MTDFSQEAVEAQLKAAFPEGDEAPDFKVYPMREGYYVDAIWQEHGGNWTTAISVRGTVKTPEDLAEFIRAVRQYWDT